MARAAYCRFLVGALVLGCAATAGDVTQAQPAPAAAPARPRIGLVLGGGGAKGAAHVGVLKALEAMRIPVDCIAGTSMGSIVGAAYATGLDAQEIEKVITGIEWKDILRSAPRVDVPYRRKEQDALFTNGLELGVAETGGLRFPGGIVPTHQIETMFKGIVAAAGADVDFDRLPIPFRAVATDLETGEMVLFDHGDLSIAMRASMAVPGAFSPVKYNGRLLVDGMLVRNLPVDVARKTCADVVIAVPVANPRARLDQLGSLLAVTNQAMNVAVEANERTQLATLTERDVAIPVVLEGIGSTDFAKADDAIPVGEAAARRVAPALMRYSLSPEAYAQWRAGLGKLTAGARPKIDEVRLLGFDRTNPEVMRNLIDVQPGDLYDPKVSTRDAGRLVARRDYTAVSYDLVQEGDRNVLVYRATEKPWGPRYLMFDLNMSTDGKANTAWGARVNYQERWLNALGGEIRADAQLGRPNLLQAEFYQPLDPHLRFFVAPSVQWKQTLEYVYSGDRAVSQVDLKRYSLGLDAGVALGTWGEWRIGLQRGHASIRNKVGDQPLPDEGQADIGAATMRLSVDTLDQRLFPRHGDFGALNAMVSRKSLGASRDYKLVSAIAGKAFELEGGVVTVALRGGTDLHTDAPYYDQFRLGGMFNFSGYTDGQLVGREYGLGGVMYRRRLAYLAESLGTAIYGGVTAELGQVYERADGTRVSGLQTSGSLFIGIDSKIGPVYFAYGRAQGGHSAIYLYVGSSFEAFRP